MKIRVVMFKQQFSLFKHRYQTGTNWMVGLKLHVLLYTTCFVNNRRSEEETEEKQGRLSSQK